MSVIPQTPRASGGLSPPGPPTRALPLTRWGPKSGPQTPRLPTPPPQPQILDPPLIMMSRIDCRHWKISTGRHFQNGHHNTAQIQHCPMSTLFHMWVDYDVPNWFLTSNNFYRSPFSKWPTQYRTSSTLFEFNVLNWFPILKNFYRSPFSKWPPQYRKNSTLFDFKGSF